MSPVIRIYHIGDQAEYELIARLLADVHHQDYLLAKCASGDDLLNEILSPHYDVILLDYHWGDAGCAKDLVAGARAQDCSIPILVMTDDMEADVDREAIQEGASDYLIKGHVDTQLIERTIRYAIERKKNEIKLSQLAHYDPLTKVANRLLFHDRLEHALQLAGRGEKHLTLMYMDLNGFKEINDRFGHEAGDKLLQSCAERISDCMRRSDSLARIGGDEFMLLLEHTNSTLSTARIAKKIIHAIEKPHHINNHRLLVGCSIGIAVYPGAGRDADTLQRNADIAMYQAKQTRRSDYRFFTEAMNLESRRQLLMQSDLQYALEHRELTLFYQPRINLDNRKTEGVATDIRWYHPGKGWLQADRFKALSEHTGLIMPLQQWAFDQLCRDLDGALSGRGPRRKKLPRISIRLSGGNLDNPHVLQQLKGYALKENDGHLGPVEFLLPESMLVEKPDEAFAFVRDIQRQGYLVSLSDFAGENTRLPLLQKLNPARLELATDLTNQWEDPDARQVIKLAVVLARELNKPLMAAQVNDPDQLHCLGTLGCRIVSGRTVCPDQTLPELVRSYGAGDFAGPVLQTHN